jgi:hypothetical protein
LNPEPIRIRNPAFNARFTTNLPYFLIDSLKSLEERDANTDEHLLLCFLDRFSMPLLFETCSTNTEHEESVGRGARRIIIRDQIVVYFAIFNAISILF